MKVSMYSAYLSRNKYAVSWKIGGLLENEHYIEEGDVDAFTAHLNRIELAINSGKWKQVVLVEGDTNDKATRTS